MLKKSSSDVVSPLTSSHVDSVLPNFSMLFESLQFDPAREASKDVKLPYTERTLIKNSFLRKENPKKWMSSLKELSFSNPVAAAAIFDEQLNGLTDSAIIDQGAASQYIKFLNNVGRHDDCEGFIKTLCDKALHSKEYRALAQDLNKPQELDLRFRIAKKAFQMSRDLEALAVWVDAARRFPDTSQLREISSEVITSGAQVNARVFLIKALVAAHLKDEAGSHMVPILKSHRGSVAEKEVFDLAHKMLKIPKTEMLTREVLTKLLTVKSSRLLSALEAGDDFTKALEEIAPTRADKMSLLDEVNLSFTFNAYKFKDIAYKAVVSLQLVEKDFISKCHVKGIFFDTAELFTPSIKEFVALRQERGVDADGYYSALLASHFRYDRPEISYELTKSPTYKVEDSVRPGRIDLLTIAYPLDEALKLLPSNLITVEDKLRVAVSALGATNDDLRYKAGQLWKVLASTDIAFAQACLMAMLDDNRSYKFVRPLAQAVATRATLDITDPTVRRSYKLLAACVRRWADYRAPFVTRYQKLPVDEALDLEINKVLEGQNVREIDPKLTQYASKNDIFHLSFKRSNGEY